MSFFERKEIKDMLAYLRFFANPADELSLLRVLKVPSKGITPSMLEILDDFAAVRKMSLWDAFERYQEAPNLTDDQKARIQHFLDVYKPYFTAFTVQPLASTFKEVLEASGYLGLLKQVSKNDDEYKMRLDNVEEMIHGLETFEFRFKNKKPTLAQYLQDIALLSSDDKDNDEQRNRGVTLMTLHKSKGLEFPVVFLAGLDSDHIPSPMAIKEGMIEEERRLFYVGMTRARKQLYLTYPASKVFRGKLRPITPCRFLNEIPEQFLDGKIGDRQDEEKLEYFDNFFKEMQAKLSAVPTQEVK